ncbi:LPS export ABC transporter protein LptC [Allopseudospirillum japonicum]|uniref:LPS export ABC transporter protein LptC n=1 Tax=Allopseudospirillum japonicum TaxID=64971 RepID=A0A1H6QKL8_9GAMM|nr:LPS export ABC transporter periplasmic protein LptC [Allopseudospirillum japonicum]SEI40020.1 LPS export ABC transporter protein LptC [Allopseudospirillum japonicum]
MIFKRHTSLKLRRTWQTMRQNLSKYTSSSWLGLLGLIALGILVWLMQETHYSPPETALPNAQGEPDYYLENARLTLFNAQGQAQHQIFTPKLTHYPQTQNVHLAQPQMLTLDQKGSQWQLLAQQAYYNEAQQDLRLEGNILLTQTESQLSIQLQALQLDLEQGLAYSEHALRLLQGNVWELNAQGIQLDLNTGNVTLPAQVRAHYQTAPKQPEPTQE